MSNTFFNLSNGRGLVAAGEGKGLVGIARGDYTAGGCDASYSTSLPPYFKTSFPSNPYLTSIPATFAGASSYSPEQPVVVSGKQFVIVCGAYVEYEDTKDKAQATAERLAHAHQTDAFILAPVSRTAPKRDVVTTEIEL